MSGKKSERSENGIAGRLERGWDCDAIGKGRSEDWKIEQCLEGIVLIFAAELFASVSVTIQIAFHLVLNHTEDTFWCCQHINKFGDEVAQASFNRSGIVNSLKSSAEFIFRITTLN
jgi:hypothetical protein